jgi:hypothetical protein
MNLTRKVTRLVLASAVIGGLALATVPAALAGGGLQNCVDVTGSQINRVGCWEDVWADGTQHRMTFSNTQYGGGDTIGVDAFYVLAPQADVAQGALPFAHDHVVRDLPQGNGGTYSTKLRGYFVLCSEQGIVSGSCEPTLSVVDGFGTVPVAHRVNGAPLTSAASIETAADAGMLLLIDTGSVIVATTTASR